MKRLIIGIYAGPALVVVGVSVVLMEQIFVIMCGVFLFGTVMSITCWLLTSSRFARHRRWPILLGAITCLAIIASVMTIHWPLRARYLLSRPSLDRLAEDVRAGQPFAGPTQVGLFTIVEAEVNRHGIVCLWIDGNPSGKTGFVQCGPDYIPFNLWSMVSLDDRWQFISED
jgi:hypothetical protein